MPATRVLTDGGAIDLVLTDVAMPSMTGFTLAARIREQFPGVVIVFMSGYLGDDHLEGGEHFVQKPFTPPVLFRTIRRALGDAAEPTAISSRSRAA